VVLGLGSGTIGDLPPLVAHYAVIYDSPMSLGVGGDIDYTFEFRLGSYPDAIGRAPWESQPVVVSLLLVRATDLNLQVRLNDLKFTRTYAPGPERTVHEVIGPAAKIGDNQLTFRVLAGSLRFSDLLIWYKGGI
jgi:hypothetical protein